MAAAELVLWNSHMFQTYSGKDSKIDTSKYWSPYFAEDRVEVSGVLGDDLGHGSLHQLRNLRNSGHLSGKSNWNSEILQDQNFTLSVIIMRGGVQSVLEQQLFLKLIRN